MTTVSSFYDGKSGRLMQMRDLQALELPNPMDFQDRLPNL